MINKDTLTLEEAKTEIRTTISSQRYRDSMKAFRATSSSAMPTSIPRVNRSQRPSEIGLEEGQAAILKPRRPRLVSHCK